ncbi:hypothetical protein G7K_2149-t1 [Saitoella complicata NRRL Y-17804]|uniref:Uncharacterized protein n=1 Tax=Saitoella complicata (strain BCRC 22490 / CBS 7301 / JCM 7358 / NBRC 10748 / NRRL Y-17804) TaxID=698492 RepID=A0A0E9NEY0_SAICN|nr:hypothetical protein G7K_2149-t1 [Saitoella complicata NRRL Y-17804]
MHQLSLFVRKDRPLSSSCPTPLRARQSIFVSLVLRFYEYHTVQQFPSGFSTVKSRLSRSRPSYTWTTALLRAALQPVLIGKLPLRAHPSLKLLHRKP